MIVISHLESLLTKPAAEWVLDADLSQIQSKSLAASLWNVALKLTELSNNSSPILSFLSELRFHSCTILNAHLEPSEMTAKWLRTCKACLDASEYPKAFRCLSHIEISRCEHPLLIFHYHLWRTQLEFLTENEFSESLRLAISWCKELPNERFRLVRFIYVEVCQRLVRRRKYMEMVWMLKECIELSRDSLCEALKEINYQCRVLLCECLIEGSKPAKAKAVLDELPESEQKILLAFKARVFNDSFEEMLICLDEILRDYKISTALTAVDILVSRNKLVDACKCLLVISRTYQTYEVFVGWFKIIFALELANAIDSTIEYLSASKVIDQLVSNFPCSSEVKKILFDYIIEISHKDKALCVAYIEKFYFPICKEEEHMQAALICAECYIDIKQPSKAIELLSRSDECIQVLLIRTRAKVQLGCYQELSGDILAQIPLLDLIKLIKDIYNYLPEHFETAIQHASDPLLSSNNPLSIKVLLVKWLTSHIKTTDETLKFFYFALANFDCDDLMHFALVSWNLSIDQPNPDLKVKLLMISLKFLTKAKQLNSSDGIHIFKGICNWALLMKRKNEYGEIISAFSGISAENNDENCRLLKAELSVASDLPIDFEEFKELTSIKYLALAAIRHSRLNTARTLWSKYLEIRLDFEAVQSMIKIANSFDEAERLLRSLLDLQLTSAEVDWIIGYCWNNSISGTNVYQSLHAKTWLRHALSLAEKTGHCLTEKLKSLYKKVCV